MFFTLRPTINNTQTNTDNSENFISIEVAEPSQLYRYISTDICNNDFDEIPDNFFMKDELNLFKNYREFS